MRGTYDGTIDAANDRVARRGESHRHSLLDRRSNEEKQTLKVTPTSTVARFRLRRFLNVLLPRATGASYIGAK